MEGSESLRADVIAEAYTTMANAQRYAEVFDHALELIEHAYEVHEQSEDIPTRCYVETIHAAVLRDIGELERAGQMFHSVAQVYRNDLHDYVSYGSILITLADVYQHFVDAPLGN